MKLQTIRRDGGGGGGDGDGGVGVCVLFQFMQKHFKINDIEM